MLDYDLKIDLVLQGPILTHSTAVGTSGVSSPFARNSKNEHYLPGTLIKGRLRQAWTELQSAVGAVFQPDTATLLGNRSDHHNVSSYAPLRGALYFGDFTSQRQHKDQTRYRISIEAESGAVKKGFYQVLDAPYQVGAAVTFSGAVRFSAADTNTADQIRQQVEIGLRWITSFGAERSVGFGRLLNVKVSPLQKAATVAKTTMATGADVLSLKLSPSAPFCIARRRIDPNLFESDSILPGAAIKGSLASTWLALLGQPMQGTIDTNTDPVRPELCRHFEKVRFTHAFPVEKGHTARAVTAPLSTVKAGKKVYDVARSAAPLLLQDENNELVAPEFAIDWKTNNDVQQKFGWVEPGRELRVRTAIDSNRRKAKDEQLFAYEKVVPHKTDWFCQIDLGAVPQHDQSKVEAQLLDLLSNGIGAIGKTKAHVAVEVLTSPLATMHVSQNTSRNGVWIVTLQTPALLCDQDSILQSNLYTAYQAAWAQLSGNTLQLAQFFAQQSLAGGQYLWHRFQAGKPYSPWLLTDPGSVFVLQATPGLSSDAQTCIDQWLAHGLPLPEWAVERYGNHWTTCPFLPEGGYGEIAVNLDVHWTSYPRQGEAHVIS
ncbi:MAG: hypothetical protein HYR56_21230 [Acidobacteria bacterium]|nr:hypothetical protein [Acidobacteriota bacterium]MBI3427569.1 hypothetical protein [Acidobacteriota bacterium]